MKIAIATASQEKISGIKKAIIRLYQIGENELEVFNAKTNSEVPEQPFNEQNYEGALNRINNLIKVTNSTEFDLYISCEAGIESILDNYFNVQVVCIYDVKTNKHFFGKSSGWQIPKEDIERIKEINLDSYMRQKGFNSLEELTEDENLTRSNLITEATIMALASKKLL